MGTLTNENSDARELVTEILDQTLWWKTLRLVVEFLHRRAVEKVRIEFGFVLDRDITGKQQGQDQVVRLGDLENVIRAGIEEGTIEWNRSSDFLFYPLGTDLAFMLCNDADLHFASSDETLLADVVKVVRGCGTKVYDSGRLL